MTNYRQHALSYAGSYVPDMTYNVFGGTSINQSYAWKLLRENVLKSASIL